MVPLCEMLLYGAARAQHIQEKIKPWLADGRIVVCDRFADSTVVYQGYARGLNQKMIADLQTITCGDFKPDLTFVIDLPVEEGLRRARQRMQDLPDKEDRFENEVVEFHQKVQDGFLDLALKEPGRIVVLDGLQTVEELQNQIWRAVQAKIVDRAIETI